MMGKNTQHGFTLVELAISLMIIGILIGAVLKGDELIKNARATQSIKYVNEYKSAMNVFRTTYEGLPGDIVNASTRIAGCTGSCTAPGGIADTGTNGDNIVGSTYTYLNSSVNVTIDYRSENSNFWLQMILAKMLEDKRPNTTTVNLATVMESPVSGAYFYVATFDATAANTAVVSGLYVVQGPVPRTVNPSVIPGVPTTSAVTGGAMSPTIASQIDRKVDDGNAVTGSVVVANDSSKCQAAGVYLTTDPGPSCNMMYRIFDIQ